jgi:hypothetical protein
MTLAKRVISRAEQTCGTIPAYMITGY